MNSYYEAHAEAVKALEGAQRVVEYLEAKIYAAEFENGPTEEKHLERKLAGLRKCHT